VELKRVVSAGMLASLNGTFYPVAMVYLDWPGGAVYAHTGVGTIAFGGNDYLGIGAYGSIEVEQEALDLVPGEAVLVLAGSIENLLAQMGVDARGRRCTIYMGTTTTPGGNVLTGAPSGMFNGFVDARDFQFDRDNATIEHAIVLTVASGVPARSGATVTHNAADQTTKFAGDTAGRHTIYSEADRVNPPKW